MIEHLNRLSGIISSRLKIAKEVFEPSDQVIRALLEIAYFASLKTEEGRFVGGNITYADPKKPEKDPPLTRRADYPSFTNFRRKLSLTVENFVKLARAINSWTASIVVYGTTKHSLVIWGVVDQLSQHNMQVNREGLGGYRNPGILTINIDGIGALSVYHENLFLCAIRQDKVVTQENKAIQSVSIANRLRPALLTRAKQIATVIEDPKREQNLLGKLHEEWIDIVSRLCIGLRRLNTGGSLLITPKPVNSMLNVVHQFPYCRLGEAFTLKVLDNEYLQDVRKEYFDAMISNSLSASLAEKYLYADTDAIDRDHELTGAVKLVTSLASADGIVLMTPSLEVVGFGVKIVSARNVHTVYDGSMFTRKCRVVKKINISKFGTRHGSMLRYCHADRNAVGIVISQDGHVRVIMSIGKSLVMWENVQLLRYPCDVRGFTNKKIRAQVFRDIRRKATSLGYTKMPKTIKALFRCRSG